MLKQQPSIDHLEKDVFLQSAAVIIGFLFIILL
jgi:hypothetical protein